MKQLILLLIAVLAASTGSLRAQTAHRTLQLQAIRPRTFDQLPVRYISDAMRDDEGYLWYATYGGGICRDNGYQLDLFRSDRNTPELIANNDVLCMAQLPDRRIVFSTKEGIYVIDKCDYSVRPFCERLAHSRVQAILADHSGRLWIDVDDTLHLYSSDGQLLCSQPTTWQGHPAKAMRLYEDDDHTIWMTLWQGALARIVGGRYEECAWTDADSPHAIGFDHDNHCLWVSCLGSGIVAYDPQTGQSRRYLSDLHLSDMGYDPVRHILWGATADGIVAISTIGGQPTLLTLDMPELPHENNRHIRLQPDGRIWTLGSTYSNRLLTPPTHTAPLLSSTEESAARTMSAIKQVCAPSKKGGAWAVVDSQLCLVSYDDGILRSTPAPLLPIKHPVRYLSDNGRGQIYICIQGRIMRYDYRQAATATAIATPTTIATDLNIISDVAEDSDGTIYCLCAARGFIRLTPQGETWRTDTLSDRRNLTSMAIDHRRNCIWVGDIFGNVFRINTNKHAGSANLQPVPEASSAEGNLIQRLCLDPQGHLWMLCETYISEYSPDYGNHRSISIYDRRIPIDNCNDIMPCAQGIVAIGTGSYHPIAHTAQLDGHGTQLTIKVSSYTTDGEKHLLPYGTGEISIAPSVQHLEICLTTLDISEARRTRFAFRMGGKGRQWSYLPQGSNIISLLNPQKGTYDIEVRATDANGCWSLSVHCLTVRRLPAWWETWWARTLYALLLVALMVGIVQYYKLMRHRRERFEHLLKLLRQKEEEPAAPQPIATEESEQPTDETADNTPPELSAYDQKFLQKATKAAEDNLDNPDYDVTAFSSDMCMSRMNLYRKLHTLTGQSPSDFLKTYRLNKAAELILNSDLSTAEIADRVGFSSSGYFTTCFKRHYGVLPKNYKG